MDVSDSKKYYYLKLKDNFFESDSMVFMESMKDGHLYSNILLKLYLKSLKDEGRLLFNDRIPYNVQMIASITRHQVESVEKALQVFQELGLIEVLDSGVIYMMDIQSYIGKSSTEADRKRGYRNRIENEKGQMSHQMSGQNTDIFPPEIRDKRLENRDINSIKDTICQTDVRRILEEWNRAGVSEVKKLIPSSNRYKMLAARIKEYGADQVLEAVGNIKSSPFLKGDNSRCWMITFEWFVKPNNFPKVLEGNYNKGNSGGVKGGDEHAGRKHIASANEIARRIASGEDID